MIKQVLTWPNKILSQESLLWDGESDLRPLITDLWETLLEVGGVGLSAIQIGVPLQVFVLDDQFFQLNPEGNGCLVFANTKVVHQSIETKRDVEGCLSFPDIWLMIERPIGVFLQYLDVEGKEQEIFAENFLARALLHEHDHGNGLVFLNYVGRLKKQMVERRLWKRKKSK